MNTLHATTPSSGMKAVLPLKVEKYPAVIQENPGKYPYPIGPKIKVRFRIVDANGTIVDDAQGYVYKHGPSAYKTLWYRFGGGREKIRANKQLRQQILTDHPDFANEYRRLLKNLSRDIHFTKEDWGCYLKPLMEKYGIDQKHFKLFARFDQ